MKLAVLTKTLPYALLGLCAYSIWLEYRGSVISWASGWTTHLLLPQAALFMIAGLWLLARTNAPGAGMVRGLGAALRGKGPVPAALLLPVFCWWAAAVNRGFLERTPALGFTLLCLLCTAVAAVLLRPKMASIAAVAGLTAYGGYGVVMMIYYPAFQAGLYGLVPVTNGQRASLAGVQGLALLAATARLWPRALADSPTRALAERAGWLSQRVQRLTQTRADAADAALAELRRVERDLHDGAQARLVALGMSLRTAEKLMLTSPEAALELVTEARETSSRALSDLRDLVRGIYPPLLADRGLADALRSLALDGPLPAEIDIDMPNEDVPMPVAAAVYFAAAEALANAVHHSGAARVQIRGFSTGQALRVEITDDGHGGADPSRGTGLAGVERRLAVFDGIMAVSSPAGGPTIIVIEVPCASSSAKISTC